MPSGIITAPEEYQRRQTKHVSDLPGLAVIADEHVVFGCGNTIEETCKDHDNNLHELLEIARKIGCSSIQQKYDYVTEKYIIRFT